MGLSVQCPFLGVGDSAGPAGPPGTLQASPGPREARACPGQNAKRVISAEDRLRAGCFPGGRVQPTRWDPYSQETRGAPPSHPSPAAPSEWRGPILPLAGLPLYSSKTAWPDQSIRGSNKSSLPARAENPEASTGVWSAQWWGARFPAAGLAASVCPLAFLGPPKPGLDLTFWPGALLPNDSRKGGGGRTANLDASSSSLFRIIMPGDVS